MVYIVHGVITRPGILPLSPEHVPEQRKPAGKERASHSITELLEIRKIGGSLQIHAILGIRLHVVVCAIGIVVQRRLEFEPTVLQRPCQVPFAFETVVAVYVGVELCLVVGVLMIIRHPPADTVGPVIWHRHVAERTVTGVEATHIHLIHLGEGVAVDSPSIAMACDVEKGLNDISAKES